MTRAVLLVLLSSALVACGAEPEGTEGGRFDDDTDVPTRTDEVVSSEAPKTADPSAADPAEAAPADPGARPASAAPTNTCQSARDLGAIAGDKDGSTVTAQGTCSEWLRIRATEMRAGPLAGTMKLSAMLVSPPGADFDLRVLVNVDEDLLECSTATGKSDLPAGRTDVVKVSWGEKLSANFSDDQRPVSIEVRAKTPADCGKGNWTLLLEGNE